MPKFNLLDEDWIKCIDSTGQLREMGIRQILTDAQHVKRLANPIPIVNASVLFLLETILIRALSNAGVALDDCDEWFEGYKAGVFNEKKLDAYFQEWYARFYLLDDKHPFLQTIIEDQNCVGTAMKLLPHFSGGTGGNSATLFDQHTMQEGISLSLIEAANYLLAAHQYGAGGRIIGPDYFSESLPANGLSFFVEGENFFETLYLNLLPYPDSSIGVVTKTGDCPLWERDDPDGLFERNSIDQGKTYQPLGLLDLLTWPGRKIQLLVDSDHHVKEIKMHSGLKLADQIFPWYAYNKKGYDLRARVEYAMWRDFPVLFQFREMVSEDGDKSQSPRPLRWLHELGSAGYEFDHPFYIAGLGMAKEAGKQKVSFYSEQRLPLPRNYLLDLDLVLDISNALDLAELVQKSLYGAMMNFAETYLSFDADKQDGRKPDPKDKKNLFNHLGVERLYWEALEKDFFNLIVNLLGDRENAINQWKTAIRSSALIAFEGGVGLTGESIRTLKASVKSRRNLNFKLNEYLGKIERK